MISRLGRYELLRELGRGGMGIVYLGVDPAIGRHVAIKTIRLDQQAAGTEGAGGLRERLLREAQTAGGLSHPNIVAIHDVGAEGDVAFIVMEFVAGRGLDAILNQSAPGIGGSLRILSDAAVALDYAHACQVVHRDVKPANIIVSNDGIVKLVDFGIAKIARSAGGGTMTQTGVLVGSPEYMSPEQLKGQPATPRSDQFSLAAIAYQLLTGRKPFEAETLEALFCRTLLEDPPPAQSINAALPGEVDQVLRRGLAKDPAARYGTCAEFTAELSRVLGKMVTAGPPRRSTTVFATAPVVLPASTAAGPAAQKPAYRRLRSPWFPALTVGALLLAGWGAIKVAGFREQDEMAWKQVKDTAYEELFEYYLRTYPFGSHTAAAREKIRYLQQETGVWTPIQDSSDPEQFRTFLQKYPNGRYSLEARARLTSLELAAQQSKRVR
jgi:hypothetical protein